MKVHNEVHGKKSHHPLFQFTCTCVHINMKYIHDSLIKVKAHNLHPYSEVVILIVMRLYLMYMLYRLFTFITDKSLHYNGQIVNLVLQYQM